MTLPTYKNETEVIRSYNNVLWSPNQERAVDFFVPPEVGLTETSDQPHVDGTVWPISDVVSISTGNSVEIQIPMCVTVRASFVCLEGEAQVRVNYPSSNAVTISPSICHEFVRDRPYIEKIIITAVSESRVVYDVERVDRR
jgi:hypothetical protein